MFFKKKNKTADIDKNDPVIAAVIPNTVDSEIYQDILKKNNIPFVCRQRGAGGYLKILTGGFLIADSIYVKSSDLGQAKELYEAFFSQAEENSLSGCEEE